MCHLLYILPKEASINAMYEAVHDDVTKMTAACGEPPQGGLGRIGVSEWRTVRYERNG